MYYANPTSLRTHYPASFGWIVFASVRKPFRLGLGPLLLLSPT